MKSRHLLQHSVAYWLNFLLLLCVGSMALPAQEIQVAQNSTFPATTVGATATALTISFHLVNASDLSGVTVSKAQNGAQEFTAGAISGCVADGTTVNAAGSTCSVSVTFSPQYPGQRSAALLVMDGSTVLGAIGLTGTGGSPLAAYEPAVSSVVALSGVINPVAIAVDGAGNLYVADSNVNAPQVVKLAVGASTPVQLPFSGLSSPGGIAVDAAGDVYVSDSGKVLELNAQGAQQDVAVSGLQSPGALAVDAAGSLYIADAGTNQIVKWTTAGVQSTLPFTGLNDPEGVAVDASGNVFVADYFNDRVVKLPPVGSPFVVATSLGQPEGLALDAAGDLYIANDLDQNIVQLPAGGTQTIVMQTSVPNKAQSLGLPQSVAVDSAGNLYIDDVQYYQVYKIQQTQPHAAAFSSMQVGQTSFPAYYMFQNIGTQPLQISGYSDMTTGQSTSSFAQNATFTTCSTTSALNVGGQCVLGITFTPTVAATLTGAVSITDNSMNAAAPNNQQTIQTSGTGTGSATPPPPTPSVALSVSASSIAITTPGQSATVTLTLTPSGGYVGTVSLSCGSGLPAGVTCSFNPKSATFTAANDTVAQTITLTIATTAATATLRPYQPLPTQSNPMPMLAGAFWLPGLLAAGAGLRKRCDKGVTSQIGHMLVLLVLLAGVGMMTACSGGSTSTTGGGSGGGSTPTGGTPMGTSTVTVMASDGAGLNQTATFTLNVQ